MYVAQSAVSMKTQITHFIDLILSPSKSYRVNWNLQNLWKSYRTNVVKTLL